MTHPKTARDWYQSFEAMTPPFPKIDTSVEAAKARHASIANTIEAIPTGSYCYRRGPTYTNKDGHTIPSVIPCPFWAADPNKPDQQYGYCAHLKAGDWEEDGTLLLWDQCKECGVNDPDPDDL